MTLGYAVREFQVKSSFLEAPKYMRGIDRTILKQRFGADGRARRWCGIEVFESAIDPESHYRVQHDAARDFVGGCKLRCLLAAQLGHRLMTAS